MGYRGNFFGGIEEQQSDGTWRRISRGGTCHVFGSADPLLPGQRTPSTEGYFFDEPSKVRHGAWRYAVEVFKGDSWLVRADTAESKRQPVIDVYRLVLPVP